MRRRHSLVFRKAVAASRSRVRARGALILLPLAGAAAVFLALVGLRQDLDLAHHGRRTTAVVIAHYDGKGAYETVRFTLPDRRQVMEDTSFGGDGDPIGSTITIEYASDHPGTVAPVGKRLGRRIEYGLTGAFGIALLVMAASLRRGTRARGGPRDLPSARQYRGY